MKKFSLSAGLPRASFRQVGRMLSEILLSGKDSPPPADGATGHPLLPDHLKLRESTSLFRLGLKNRTK
ncbi:hypothetical protein CEXT_762181 [Caerostris extrusa]|uniref:Uncharacterized protein n=1 Tax=Caerostris extrusa TaxID=172846 RepID=A0AAV4P0B4_CAEEX|nr:hypothetical protein CEXT_762181 [Caerostris extrusa]